MLLNDYCPIIFDCRKSQEVTFKCYELSNFNVGGSLVCVIPLCRLLNLPITYL